MRREQIIVTCIDDIQSGKRTLEECAARHPEFAGELRILVSTLTRINGQTVTATPEFKQRVRIHLQQVMQEPETQSVPSRSWLRFLLVRKLSYALTAVSLVLAIGGGSTVYAAKDSLPNDTLYPVKTSVENIQLALTLSPEAKANLHLKLAERRIQEVLTESSLGLSISPSALEAATSQIDGAVQGMDKMPAERVPDLANQFARLTLKQQSLEQISKAAAETAQPALKQAIDATRRGNLVAEVAGRNPAVLGSGALVLDEKLESDYFEIEGTLSGVQSRTWNIGGLQINNVNVGERTPVIGSDVKLSGIVRNNEVFIGKMETQAKPPGDITVKGIFSGASADGSTWHVGGIAVDAMNDNTPPPPGSRLQISGKLQNGIFTASVDKPVAETAANPLQNIAKPDENQAKPNATLLKPSDNQARPGDNQAKPADNQARPGDNQARPTDNQAKPSDNQARPADNQARPADNQARPADNQAKSGDSQSKPSDSQTKPSNSQTRSDDNQARSGGN